MKSIIISGSSHPELADKISEQTQIPIANTLISKFADGETRVEIPSSVKDHNLFLIQSTSPPVNENYMELFIILEALKRCQPKKITIMMPYFGYSRQDRVTAAGSPISSHLCMHLCQHLGVHQLITVDLHSKYTEDAFLDFIKNIDVHSYLAHKLKNSLPRQNILCLSPDEGGLSRAKTFSKILKTPLAFIKKQRSAPNQAQAIQIEGAGVESKTVVIVDDIIDTAGTLCSAVDMLIQNGAKECFVVATHGLFSGSALDRIEKSAIQKIWVTDSLQPRKDVLDCSKIQVISIDQVLSEVVKSIDAGA